MYHKIIRKKIKTLFDEFNRGNFEPIIRAFSSKFEHWFVGKNHALSGCRTTLPRVRLWYERLFKIFPNIKFELHKVLVSGWPWDTVVTVEWTDYYTLKNGEKRQNCGVHIIHLKWGKCPSVRIYCDTNLLLENLKIQYKGGIEESFAEPLLG